MSSTKLSWLNNNDDDNDIEIININKQQINNNNNDTILYNNISNNQSNTIIKPVAMYGNNVNRASSTTNNINSNNIQLYNISPDNSYQNTNNNTNTNDNNNNTKVNAVTQLTLIDIPIQTEIDKQVPSNNNEQQQVIVNDNDTITKTTRQQGNTNIRSSRTVNVEIQQIITTKQDTNQQQSFTSNNKNNSKTNQSIQQHGDTIKDAIDNNTAATNTSNTQSIDIDELNRTRYTVSSPDDDDDNNNYNNGSNYDVQTDNVISNKLTNTEFCVSCGINESVVHCNDCYKLKSNIKKYTKKHYAPDNKALLHENNKKYCDFILQCGMQ